MFERKYETVVLPSNRYRSGTATVELSTATVDSATWRFAYDKGYREGNFPVPAIRQHFEFGWSLSACEPVLMHVYEGPWSH